MKLIPYKGILPKVDPSVLILDGSFVSGDVVIEKNVNIWFNVSIRGDMAAIRIGENTNIQDNAVIHVNTNTPTTIGKNVTVGHNAIIHGATVGDHCLIGMGSILLDHSIVEEGAMVGAGCLVPPGKIVPKGMVAIGNPMKIVRPLTEVELQANQQNIQSYLDLASAYEKE